VTWSILVTDGEQRSSLAVVRSLGRSRHRVYVCSDKGVSISGASRHATAERAVPSSLTNPTSFANELSALISAWKIDVLLPTTDQAFNAVFAEPELFVDVCIPSATGPQFRAISDKQRVLEVAAECGIDVPAQVVLSTPGEAASLREDDLDFPVVVKPARSVTLQDGQQLKVGVTHCANWNAFSRAIGALPEAAYPIMLQRRVVGPAIGIFLLVWDGQLLASFAHRRLREKPPAGGVSVYRESIEADPSLVSRSKQLLDRFNWRGVAMIEFKIDERTGRPYLMEINGRFWGSLQLAIDAGVDFPSLLVARAMGETVSSPSRYKFGIRSRWEWGEVDHALARLRHTDEYLSMPPGSSSRLRTVLRLLIPWRPGDRFEVLRLSDPAPFFRESIERIRGK
jgi:predicted ATP-grasp superfamily ATP-dependent carboligase